jgi:SAM-dependent methyltransferase
MALNAVWRALEISAIYDTYQSWAGADRVYRHYVSQHVRSRPGDLIVDIGCGTGTILDYLPESRYLGLDANPAYIGTATALHGSRGEFRVLNVVDATLPDIEGQADIVIMCGVLHHLNDDEARYSVALAHSLLKPGGRLVTIDGVFHGQQGILRRLVVSLDRGRFVRSAQGYLALARERFTLIDQEQSDALTRIPSSHFIMNCTKTEARSPPTGFARDLK